MHWKCVNYKLNLFNGFTNIGKLMSSFLSLFSMLSIKKINKKSKTRFLCYLTEFFSVSQSNMQTFPFLFISYVHLNYNKKYLYDGNGERFQVVGSNLTVSPIHQINAIALKTSRDNGLVNYIRKENPVNMRRNIAVYNICIILVGVGNALTINDFG